MALPGHANWLLVLCKFFFRKSGSCPAAHKANARNLKKLPQSSIAHNQHCLSACICKQHQITRMIFTIPTSLVVTTIGGGRLQILELLLVTEHKPDLKQSVSVSMFFQLAAGLFASTVTSSCTYNRCLFIQVTWMIMLCRSSSLPSQFSRFYLHFHYNIFASSYKSVNQVCCHPLYSSRIMMYN